MRTGIVLEGGAMRGMFTCGVIDVLMENNISFDCGVGVSAGAVFGCNIKSGQIGRPIRYNKKYCGDKRYCSFHSLLTTGNLYNVSFCYDEIPRKLDLWDAEAYKANPMEFHVVCTDVVTGGPVYHNNEEGEGEDFLWFQASASMPLASKIVEIGDYKLLDGGVADSIPIKYMESLGTTKNVVVLTQPLRYRKKKNKLMPLIRISLRKYPEMIKALGNRHIRYNKTLEYIREKELRKELFVIRPPEALNIGSTEKNPEELERVYQEGRKAALSSLEKLREFLKEE